MVMKIDGLFSPTIQLLERSLDVRSAKHKAIASNIANVDTPNYRPFDVYVEEALKGTKTSDSPDVELARTDGRHLGSEVQDGLIPAEHRKSTVNVQFRMDGNQVDIDQEMVDLAENGLLYNTNAQIISARLKSLKDVITNGGNT
jgi:flagellar basal-body rod protein FlgB